MSARRNRRYADEPDPYGSQSYASPYDSSLSSSSRLNRSMTSEPASSADTLSYGDLYQVCSATQQLRAAQMHSQLRSGLRALLSLCKCLLSQLALCIACRA